jgi:8-oxo-dGTP pyrophosphatase MutT (NUDIX family)
MPEAPSNCPTFNFTFHPSLASFDVPYEEYIETHPGEKFQGRFIANGAIVFSGSTPERTLLIQRAGNDSMPNLWETPGGGCDKEDPSILYGTARELWEEAGLIAASIGPLINDGYFFLSRAGKLICKFNFIVEAQKDTNGRLDVKLDPKEHQNYVWATEEEVIAGKVGDIDLQMTTKEQKAIVLAGFKVKQES